MPGALLALLAGLQWPHWPARLQQPDWSVALYDRSGQLIDVQLARDEQWRLFYQGETIPARYRDALLHFEDRHFYQHPGINPVAIARASRDNWLQQQIVSGASTITMQLARLAYGKPPRTVWQKCREIWLALQLEWHYSKEQILVMYASHAPFGGNIVGLPAASWWYFGREPAALSWSEAALLAVLPNNPGVLFPGKRSSHTVSMQQRELRQKRDRLLRQLAKAGRFSAIDLELALAEPLPTRPDGWPHQAPHLLRYLQQQQPAQFRFDSTIDGTLQQQTERALQRHLRLLSQQGVANLATIIVDHHSMQVLVYHGNQTLNAQAAGFVDIAQSPRSSGSILKPFLYAASLDAGFILPTTLQADVRSQFGSYSPANFDLKFRGAVAANRALAESLNVPAVRQLARFGVSQFKDLLVQSGLSTLTQSADHYGLSLILGGAETRLTELTQLYAALTHSVSTQSHQVAPLTYLQQPPPRTALQLPYSTGAAFLTLQALTEVERPDSEGSWRDYSAVQTIAWKTGTSFGLRDAWAIGSNGRYSIGVWAGNADGKSAPVLTGGQSAGPVLFALFQQLPTANWLSPPWRALTELQVCKADGFPQRLGCDSELTQKPKAAQLQLGPGYMRQLWLDPTGHYQLPQGCVPGVQSQPQTRLVLPLAMAWFYQQQHPEYAPPPPRWPVCAAADWPAVSDEEQIAIIAPVSQGAIMLPLQSDGKLGAAVFRAVTQDRQQTLDWHLAGKYLGRTKSPHQMAIQVPSGQYELVLTDTSGRRLTRRLQVVRAEFANTARAVQP